MAGVDGEQPALIVAGGPVDYATLDKQIDERVGSLADLPNPVPVRVSLDLASIVDLFAHLRAGYAVLPVAPEQEIRQESDLAPGSVDASVCMHTSGSSGVRRIVPLTMDNLAASVDASALRLGTNADDRWLACLPLHHIGGLSVLFRSFAAGGTAIIAPFDERLPAVIEATEPTMASMVPTMLHRLLRWDPSSLAVVGQFLVGGAHLGRDLAHEARAAGASLLPTYGLTEASSQVATARTADWPDVDGYVGRPLDGMTVTIDAPFGQAGTISIDGPAVFAGYLGEPVRLGAFVTEDLGALHADGSLTILGRRDDIIVSGGENVSLRDVERVVLGVDGVQAAAAVGLLDEEWGSTVGMMVTAESSIDELREQARDRLAPHERPKQWVAVSAIPLLANGKPDVAAIRAAFDEPMRPG